MADGPRREQTGEPGALECWWDYYMPVVVNRRHPSAGFAQRRRSNALARRQWDGQTSGRRICFGILV
jgi:hypothetical protein